MIKRVKSLFRPVAGGLCAAALVTACATQPGSDTLTLNERDYFERPGVNVLAFANPPGGLFFDAKTSGVEIIFWGQNEYVITVGGSYLFLSNAVRAMFDQP